MHKSLIFTGLLICQTAFAQTDFAIDGQPCSITGSAKRRNDHDLNRFKNRTSFPTKKDIDPKFNWTELAKFEDDRDKFSVDKAAILRGYVLRVRMSEAETCNCNSPTPEFRDTHIILTPNKNERGVLSQIVVEVTPRVRAMMASKGEDWSQKALKKLVGKEIEVQGWLMYDYKHGDQSAKIRQKTKGVTRSTAWEIHPVMAIKKL
jgi:hypothetical protein